MVREALPGDARAIAALHVGAWRAAYRGIVPDEALDSLSVDSREEFWRRVLESRSSDVVVAEEAGGLLGWVSAGKGRDPDAPPETAEVYAIYVEPESWSRGVGRRLWQVEEARLRSAGFREVTLWVLASNERARRFYERAGLAADAGGKTVRLGDVDLAEVRYRKRLR